MHITVTLTDCHERAARRRRRRNAVVSVRWPTHRKDINCRRKKKNWPQQQHKRPAVTFSVRNSSKFSRTQPVVGLRRSAALISVELSKILEPPRSLNKHHYAYPLNIVVVGRWSASWRLQFSVGNAHTWAAAAVVVVVQGQCGGELETIGQWNAFV